MAEAGERVPIRLVQENGDTLSLDATSIDMVVERIQSNFAIPLLQAKKMGIDLNQSAVAFEIQGVFTDDEGQETSSQAQAVIDFYQPQDLTLPDDEGGPTDGNGLTQPGLGLFNTVGFGTNIGTNFGGMVSVAPSILNYGNWKDKYIDLPVGYWTEKTATTDNNPVTSGISAWFKADAITADNVDTSTLSFNSVVNTWVDSSGNGITGTKSGSPRYRTAGANGQPYVYLDGSAKFDIPFNAALNPSEFTLFVVAKSTSTTNATQYIINTSPSPYNNGWNLRYRHSTNDDIVLTLYEAGSAKDYSFTTSALAANALQLHAHTVDFTGSDYTTKTYNKGVLEDTDTGDGYAPVPSSGASQIGAFNNAQKFIGGIYEILLYSRVLTQVERQQVEGYLSKKYNIPVTGSSGGAHPYAHFSYTDDSNRIRLGFDTTKLGSIKEPYGYVNRNRETDMTITNVNSSTGVLTVSGANPQHYFELSSSSTYKIIFEHSTNGFIGSNGTNTIATVIAVNSSTITCTFSGAYPATNDKVWIAASDNLSGDLQSSSYAGPCLMATIKNIGAGTDAGASYGGPEFTTHQDGSTARAGSTVYERSDEYIAFLVKNLLTSTLKLGDRPVDALGSFTLDKVFSIDIGESSHGHQTRLTITQLYATSLGRVNETINYTLSPGNMPLVQGFTGGKSGKKVKSAGDKVQDILGILANSNNFRTANTSGLGSFVGNFVDYIQESLYSEVESGDYIRGIQIPYNSKVTKGESGLDSQVAQRNHFLTTGTTLTASKLAMSNDTHASNLFAPWATGSRMNGISGIVTDFNVHRDAEMKAYEFSLKFVAADITI